MGSGSGGGGGIEQIYRLCSYTWIYEIDGCQPPKSLYVDISCPPRFPMIICAWYACSQELIFSHPGFLRPTLERY